MRTCRKNFSGSTSARDSKIKDQAPTFVKKVICDGSRREVVWSDEVRLHGPKLLDRSNSREFSHPRFVVLPKRIIRLLQDPKREWRAGVNFTALFLVDVGHLKAW